MSSTATPTGLEPVGTLSASGSFTGKMRHYDIATTYNTQISYGDIVLILADGSVALSAVTDTADAITLGIFMGCSFTDPTSGQYTNSQFWPASNAATDAKAMVCDDPDVLFKMQSAGSLAATAVGANGTIVPGAGGTLGRSTTSISATTGTVATLPLRIVEFVDGPDSAAGDAFTDVICRFNVHFHRQGLGV